MNDSIKREFESYVKFCAENGIQLIFVYPPYYHEYLQMITGLPEMYKYYKTLASRYQIPIVDCMDDPISYDKKYFFDAKHLNLDGSLLYSTSLAQKLAGYMKQEKGLYIAGNSRK